MILNWPWTAIMRFITLHICLLEPTTKIWLKIDPYSRRQKCIPGIPVSSKIRFMRIFAGICWTCSRASNESGAVVNVDFRYFRSLYLPNLHIQGHSYYIVLCGSALHWHRNRWPWMALNFALKSVLGSESNGLAYYGFQAIKLFGNLQSYAHTVSGKICSPGTLVSGDISFMWLFTGVPRRGSVKPKNCVHSSHIICCSLMSIEFENK